MKTVAAYMGDLPTLEDVMPELERLLRQTGNLRWLQWALFESSFPAMARAQWDRALARIEEAVALSGRIGYRADAAMFVAHRSWIERSRGRYGASRAAARQAVELAEEAGHPWWEGFARAMLGWTLAEMGAVDEAGEQLERGLDAAQREGSENYVARSLAHLALVAQSRGDSKRAGQLLDRTEAILGAVTVPAGGAFLHGAHAYLAAARTALARDEPDRAERFTLPIIDAARAAGWKEAAAEAATVRGRARLALGDPTRAEQFLRRSLEEIERSELPRVAWEAHAVLADVLAATRGTEEAKDHRASARAAVRSLAGSIDDEADRRSFLAATRRILRSARR